MKRHLWAVLFPHIKRVQCDACVNPDNNGSSQHHKSCSGWINLLDSLITSVSCFQLCLCPARPCFCLPPSEDLVVLPSTNRIVPFLNPSPSFLCVHVDVELTSVVELFSGRFGFSIKSGMWTGQRFLCGTLACAACELLIRVFARLHTLLLTLLLSFCFTNLSRCWGQKRFYRHMSLICSSVMRVYHQLALWEIPLVIWICCSLRGQTVGLRGHMGHERELSSYTALLRVVALQKVLLVSISEGGRKQSRIFRILTHRCTATAINNP